MARAGMGVECQVARAPPPNLLGVLLQQQQQQQQEGQQLGQQQASQVQRAEVCWAAGEQ